MTTDNTLYVEGQLVAKDITIRTYFPLDDDQLVIDLDKYYDGLCCFEVVAVESRKSEKTEGIFITYDKRRIVYEVQEDHVSEWKEEGATDVVRYVIRDINTDKSSTGKITIERLEDSIFKAKDVHVDVSVDHFNAHDWLEVEPLQIDLSWINKQTNVKVVEFGDYNERILKSVGINIDKQSELVFEFARECVNVVPCRTTEVEYAIEAEIDGKLSVSKASVIFHFQCRDFYAQVIRIVVSDPVPLNEYINIRTYNPNFASISLLSVETDTPAERGTVIPMLPTIGVTYNFNQGSGYWNVDGVQDVLLYAIKNNLTGQKAKGYIIIEKQGNTSGSGSGSGIGISSGSTVYLENSPMNTLSLTNISSLGGSYVADLSNLSGVIIQGMPGGHSLGGGRVSLTQVATYAATAIWMMKFQPSPAMPPRLNAVAEVTDLRIFFSVPIGSIPVVGWMVNVQNANPSIPSDKSYITFI